MRGPSARRTRESGLVHSCTRRGRRLHSGAAGGCEVSKSRFDAAMAENTTTSRIEEDHERLDEFARALVRIVSELTWICGRVDTVVDLDSLEGRVLTLLVTRRFWIMSVLREVVGVDRAVMAKVVGRLEKRGWLVKDGPADDRRHLVIRATDEGKVTWRQAESQRVNLLALLCYSVTTAESVAIGVLQRRVEDVMRRFSRRGWANPAFYQCALRKRGEFRHPAMPNPDWS